MIVTFIGHRKIAANYSLYSKLRDLIFWLVDYKNANTFLFGSKSHFNDLCLQVATEVKKIRPNVKLIYVRAEYPLISEDYKNYLLNFYDDTYFPDKILNAGRATYVERNFHMINQADICIFCFDKACSPLRGQISNKQERRDESVGLDSPPGGGGGAGGVCGEFFAGGAEGRLAVRRGAGAVRTGAAVGRAGKYLGLGGACVAADRHIRSRGQQSQREPFREAGTGYTKRRV